MVVLKRPTKYREKRGDTRAAPGDVKAKLQIVVDEFEEFSMQVQDLSEEEKAELSDKFSEAVDDFGDVVLQTESEVFQEKVAGLTTEEENELCVIFEEIEFAPWRW